MSNSRSSSVRTTRRKLLGALGGLPALGLWPWGKRARGAEDEVDAVTRPSRIVISSSDSDEYRRLKKLDLDDPKVAAKQARMPVGKIGPLTLGRLISGSNLISMNMHARDLHYVSDLARAYNTEERIFMTLVTCSATTTSGPWSSCRTSRSRGSRSRSWRPGRSRRKRRSSTPSKAAPISSASACSTSRSRRTPS